MAASKANYIIVYRGISQPFAATNLQTALKNPVPKGAKLEDRTILFLTYMPDEESLCVFPLSEEQIEEGMRKLEIEEQQYLARKEARQAKQETETETEEIEEESTWE
jgi:hypothetical protein